MKNPLIEMAQRHLNYVKRRTDFTVQGVSLGPKVWFNDRNWDPVNRGDLSVTARFSYDSSPTRTRTETWNLYAHDLPPELFTLVNAVLDERTPEQPSDVIGDPDDDADTVTVIVTRSAGLDGATLVMLDTTFEPDGSDGKGGLRVLVNDCDVLNGSGIDPERGSIAAIDGIDYLHDPDSDGGTAWTERQFTVDLATLTRVSKEGPK